jgi:hypothetical protein
MRDRRRQRRIPGPTRVLPPPLETGAEQLDHPPVQPADHPQPHEFRDDLVPDLRRHRPQPLGPRGFGDNRPGMVGHRPQVAFERLRSPIRQRTTTDHDAPRAPILIFETCARLPGAARPFCNRRRSAIAKPPPGHQLQRRFAAVSRHEHASRPEGMTSRGHRHPGGRPGSASRISPASGVARVVIGPSAVSCGCRLGGALGP